MSPEGRRTPFSQQHSPEHSVSPTTSISCRVVPLRRLFRIPIPLLVKNRIIDPKNHILPIGNKPYSNFRRLTPLSRSSLWARDRETPTRVGGPPRILSSATVTIIWGGATESRDLHYVRKAQVSNYFNLDFRIMALLLAREKVEV